MMRDRQVALIFLSLALFLMLLWALAPLTARLAQQKEIASLLSERRRVRQENTRLRRENRGLRKDPEYIEWMARRELGLIKSDEEAFVVIGPSKN